MGTTSTLDEAARDAAIAALAAAVDSLAQRIAALTIEVFVPLYANTFPLATVAKRAFCSPTPHTIVVQDYDWNWSNEKTSPPFQSSYKRQLFFATESEFPKIHAAGTSFFAVPVSVFHPQFIFLGPDRSTPVDDPAFKSLMRSVSRSLKSPSPLPEGSAKRYAKEFELTWVSDIPDQAEMLAKAVERYLGRPNAEDDLVEFWKERSIERALGVVPGEAADPDQARTVKAFIWGGPLASVAQKDVEISKPGNPKHRRGDGLLRLRDPDRPTLCVRLPSLSKVFPAAEIRKRHVLFCCVGYKEDRRLRDYYTKGEHLGDTPWSLTGRKFAAYAGTDIGDMVGDISRMFAAFFAAALATHQLGGDAHVGDIFDELVRDYDKFSRTVNPITQLYSRAAYVKCVAEHHDEDAFRMLFPMTAASKI